MFNVDTFVQLIADGLAVGSIYAALALAIVIVNQTTGLINFAQGGMAVLAAYFGMTFTNAVMPVLGATAAVIAGILFAVAASFVLGALIERFLMRRFMGGDPDTAVVATIGLLTLITGLCGLIWSYNYIPYPFFFSSGASFSVGGVSISVWSLTTFVTILAIMILLQLLFRATKLGLGLRAISINSRSAALSGIRVGGLLMVGWGLAAALGALAGVLVAAKVQLIPDMFNTYLVYALAAVIIGGLDSPIGAVVAAWGIAVVENLAAAYLPFVGHDLKIAVPFVLVFLVLIIKPEGLLGRKVVVRV